MTHISLQESQTFLDSLEPFIARHNTQFQYSHFRRRLKSFVHFIGIQFHEGPFVTVSGSAPTPREYLNDK